MKMTEDNVYRCAFLALNELELWSATSDAEAAKGYCTYVAGVLDMTRVVLEALKELK